ncbi:MAG: ribonuclease activity regulator RraA [Alphaproteobacteria bacterium]
MAPKKAMPLDPKTVEYLKQSSTATITMQLLKRGFRNLAISGVRPMSATASRFVGPAFTLRFIPGREDLSLPPKPGDAPSPQRQAVEGTPKDHVLVISTGGETRCGTLGDILAARLARRGVAGVVSDGAMRDTPVMAGMDLPIFACAGAAPASMNYLHPVAVQDPVGVCGVPVFPGDAMVADGDGVVVIPRHLADEVARDSFEQERIERYVQILVRKGKALAGVYPPNDETRAGYKKWLAAGEPPEV